MSNLCQVVLRTGWGTALLVDGATTMSAKVRARDDPLEGDAPYVEGDQIYEDEEEDEEDANVGAYEDEIYGKPLLPAFSLPFRSHCPAVY